MARDGSVSWDFFIAHPSADADLAQRLAADLRSSGTVFEDSMLPAGAAWDEALDAALRASRIIVALITQHTADSYYQRQEIALAVETVRREPARHRVVPVYVGAHDALSSYYSLATMTAIRLPDPHDLAAVVVALRHSLADLVGAVPGPEEVAAEMLTVLTALDAVARGARPPCDPATADTLSRYLHVAIMSAAESAPDPRGCAEWFLAHARSRGLDLRVLAPRVRDHEEAVRQWCEALTAAHPDWDVPSMLSDVATTLAQLLRRKPPELLSVEGCNLAARLLTGHEHPSGSWELPGALRRRLPSAPLPSREVQPYGDDLSPVPADDGMVRSAAGSPLARRELAAGMCRLPPADPLFSGRDAVLTDLRSEISRALHRDGSVVAVLSGQPGAGTSTVACEAVRPMTDVFPGGVLYVDLHGLDPAARRDARTVARLVCEAAGIDVGPEALDDAGLLASYRSGLAGRGILVVLDNARDSGHVRELVVRAPTCGFVVTSRDRIHDYAPGLSVHVEPLSRADAVDLLRKATAGRAIDPEHLSRMAALAGDLPMAVRLIGARLSAVREFDAEYFLQLLERELTRLDYLAVGDRAMRAVIKLSYDALDPESARALRLFSGLVGNEADAEELAACTSQAPASAELRLTRLVDRSLASLGYRRDASGRKTAVFGLPELVRIFARERLAEEEEPATSVSVTRRSVQRIAARLHELLERLREAGAEYELDPTRPLAALTIAAGSGWPEAVPLAEDLGALFESQRDLERLAAVHEYLVDAYLSADRTEDAIEADLRRAEVLTIFGEDTEDIEAAMALIRRARGRARRPELVKRVADAALRLSLRAADREDWEPARTIAEFTAETLLTGGLRTVAGPAASNCCRIAREAGFTDEELRWARIAHQLATESGDLGQRASCLHDLAQAEDTAGLAAAVAHFAEAARLWSSVQEHTNAGVANANAAATVDSGPSAPSDRRRYLELAYASWTESGDNRRTAHAGIELSACQAAEGRLPAAEVTLREVAACLPRPEPATDLRAWGERDDEDEEEDDTALLRFETEVRLAALRLLDGEGTPELDEAPEGCAQLLLEAAQWVRAGKTGWRIRNALTDLVRRRTLHPPPPFDFWLFRETPDLAAREQIGDAGLLQLGD
ncbi:TIR domain-containing protein [Actinoplanes sp. NPDC051475]|uniref:TIR domain-containing protein n=1 Tax=Actinoplanes sp. NPDC051475 TaxID=3157225 RepID=UPI00344B1372